MANERSALLESDASKRRRREDGDRKDGLDDSVEQLRSWPRELGHLALRALPVAARCVDAVVDLPRTSRASLTPP